MVTYLYSMEGESWNEILLMIVTAMVVSMTLNSTAVVEKSEVNVTGSSEQIQPEEKAANSKPVQWSEGFVVWNGGNSYKVLKHAVLPSFKAGTKLGEVSREIDHADVADHRAPEGYAWKMEIAVYLSERPSISWVGRLLTRCSWLKWMGNIIKL